MPLLAFVVKLKDLKIGRKLDNEQKMSRTIAYLRISTEKQDLDNQRLSIMDYAHVKFLALKENIILDGKKIYKVKL